MKITQIVRVGVVFGALLGTCLAQDWYHERQGRYQGEGWRPHLFEQVGQDLDHIFSAGAASDRERARLDKTREELGALQAKLDQGVFDNGTVNDVIDSLRKSANDDRLGPRDREVLADDAARIHDYQRNHNHWIRR